MTQPETRKFFPLAIAIKLFKQFDLPREIGHIEWINDYCFSSSYYPTAFRLVDLTVDEKLYIIALKFKIVNVVNERQESAHSQRHHFTVIPLNGIYRLEWMDDDFQSEYKEL
ncbi:MAG: hypothetical protein WCJ54_08380 [Actinomycetota bacterium]